MFKKNSTLESILINNITVVNDDCEEVTNVAIENGKIVFIGDIPNDFNADVTINGKDKHLIPGLIDLNVEIGEPNREDRESIVSGTKAAVAGGITAIALSPHKDSLADDQSKIRYLKYRSEDAFCKVYPLGAITQELDGKELAPYGEMQKAGALAISNGNISVENSGILKNAFNYSRTFDMPLLLHCEAKGFVKGAMNESALSTYLGLPGIPSIVEEIDIARNIMIAEYTGARIHIHNVSTEIGVEQIRLAKARGVNVTADTAPHYFILTEDAVHSYNPNYKVNPPLRQEKDRLAIIEGLRDGTIDAIASSHQPKTFEEKNGEFDLAEFGVIGLETLLSSTVTELLFNQGFSLAEIVNKVSTNPAEILGINKPSIKVGGNADLTIIDLNEKRTISSTSFYSKSSNSPFIGKKLCGSVEVTIVNGSIVYKKK